MTIDVLLNDADPNGDVLTLTVSDGKGGTATATVTIIVTLTGQPGTNGVYLPLIRR